jgi:hypothetical protein
MKLAVVGSRNITNKQEYSVFEVLRGLPILENGSVTIVSGGAKGVDSVAKEFSDQYDYPCIEFLPDWETYGKGAGIIRNKQIVKECDKLIAFWDGKSRGTKNSIDLAEKAGKLLAVFYLENM